MPNKKYLLVLWLALMGLVLIDTVYGTHLTRWLPGLVVLGIAIGLVINFRRIRRGQQASIARAAGSDAEDLVWVSSSAHVLSLIHI